MTKPAKLLTRRQYEVLIYVQNYLRQRGYPPTMREIQGYFGFASFNAVSAKRTGFLAALEKKGFIRCGFKSARSIQLLRPVCGTPISVVKGKVMDTGRILVTDAEGKFVAEV